MTIDSDLDQKSARSIVVESVNADDMVPDNSGTELYNPAVALCSDKSRQQLHLHSDYHHLSIPDLHVMASAAIETQRRNLPLLATTEICSGGTYIVTGANTGLGFEAAKHLVPYVTPARVRRLRRISKSQLGRLVLLRSGRSIWPAMALSRHLHGRRLQSLIGLMLSSKMRLLQSQSAYSLKVTACLSLSMCSARSFLRCLSCPS
jgi:hypothetical protein